MAGGYCSLWVCRMKVCTVIMISVQLLKLIAENIQFTSVWRFHTSNHQPCKWCQSKMFRCQTKTLLLSGMKFVSVRDEICCLLHQRQVCQPVVVVSMLQLWCGLFCALEMSTFCLMLYIFTSLYMSQNLAGHQTSDKFDRADMEIYFSGKQTQRKGIQTFWSVNLKFHLGRLLLQISLGLRRQFGFWQGDWIPNEQNIVIYRQNRKTLHVWIVVASSMTLWLSLSISPSSIALEGCKVQVFIF